MTDYKQLYYELYGDIVTASQVLEKLIKKNQARFFIWRTARRKSSGRRRKRRPRPIS